ncbi:molybdopterin cofactor-binding domain-containing protein [uncultured Paraglaciecola sp.]|uniref:xanthine dehydrogenase family protein molybdopterin-binding subunit n=1 Tax=uncultured Paraglaciecola sp. TaxID=1765024 RepID=UPI00260CE2FC|nr:molybdopterin cofactor-binding domain-containing protein [uncultured Paraglaciecola sp.]
MSKLTRRAFLTAGLVVGGGLVVGVAIRPGHRTPKLAEFMQKDDEVLVNAWVKLLPDNSVTVIVSHAEMGQGAQSALATMLADEMDVDWATVTVEEAPAHGEYANFHMAREFLLPGKMPGVINQTINGVFLTISKSIALQVTGGSYSIRSTGERGMRVAGAAARELLIQAAAQQWQVAATEIRAENSHLYHDASNRQAPYIEFAKSAAAQQGSDLPTLKTPDQFKLMGNEAIQRLDIPEKVDGTAQFGIDVVLPDMKYATVKTAPVFGSKLESVDSAAAEKMQGVIKVVKLGNGVGVIADSYWQAKKAIAAVNVSYSKSAADNTSSDTIMAQFRTDMDKAVTNGDEETDVSVGNARKVIKKAAKVVSAEYSVPYLAHTTMEPMNCTALVKDGKVEVWTGTQNPLGIKASIADDLEIDVENVTVNNVYLGGGFGRRAMNDYPTQAALLAKAVPGLPVKMIWSREEDTQHDFYRPAVLSRFNAALDDSGLPTAWDNQYVDKHEPKEAPYIPYQVANQFIHYIESPTHIPFGPWRSVDHSQHAFFTESFIDELAAAAKQEPLAYRRGLLQSQPRYLNVLNAVAKMSNWDSPLPQGWGRGIAIHGAFNSIVAEVVEVDMSAGDLKVMNVYCVADAGFAYSPNAFRAQMESGIIFGLTAALHGEITIKDGAVKQSNLHDYQMVRMNTAPDIFVEIINSGERTGGAGEPGTPPIAPALTNAIFAATGKRIRQLPVKLS